MRSVPPGTAAIPVSPRILVSPRIPRRAARRRTPLAPLCAVVLGSTWAACVAVQSEPERPAARATIPLEALFSNPAATRPELSPDGRSLAWIADRDGVPNVWIRSLGEASARPVTTETGDGVDSFTWTADGGSVLILKDRDGDRQYGLHMVDVATGRATEVARFDDTQVHVLGVSPARPGQVLLSMNREAKDRFDVYRLDTSTGELVRVVRNPGFLGSPSGPQATWHVDRDLEVRAAIGERPDGGADLYAPIDGEWVLIGSWSLELGEPVVISATADAVWLLDPREANAARLVRVGLDGAVDAPVAGDPEYDVDAVLVNLATREPVAAAVYRDRRVWSPLAESVEADFAALADACAGDISIVSRSADDQLWLVACDRSDHPGEYLLLRRDRKTVEMVLERQPLLDGHALAVKRPVRFEARDGLTVHGYVSFPPGVSPVDLPTVALVHGGPWARDKGGFDRTVQWLANRGFAVLQVNFRGSTGYGHRFAAAGKRQFGAGMQDDVTDGVLWGIDQGFIDADRVAIMGGSYGGYAALAGLAFTPELYRAGVSIVGFGNLITLLERVAPMFQSSVAFFHNYAGDPRTDAEDMRRRSPFFHVDRIRAPVLLGHGRNDPLVPVEESEEMARALTARGIPTTLVIWPNEGHGLTHPDNRLAFYGLAERFLACHVLDRTDTCAGTAAGG